MLKLVLVGPRPPRRVPPPSTYLTTDASLSALGCRPTSVEIQRESGIQSFASWPGYPTSSLAVWVMRNSLVPQRRIRVRYVTVTKIRGYSCTAEVPVVSVSAVVEDFPHGSICHIPTATTRRNRARARLESEPHDLGGLPLSRLRGISPGSDNSHVFPDYSQLFPDRTLAERLSTSTLEPIAQQLNCR
jgi:hypothetical protein